jgi:DNA-binding IclR family transcriptional regulator
MHDPAAPDVAAKGSSERTLLVLSTLAQLGRGASIAELATLTGLAQSTLYRQVAALRRWGFVVGRQNIVSPGPMCVPLARGFDQASLLTLEAQAELEALSGATEESVGLMVAVKHQVVCLDMVESSHPLRCSFVKGRMLPLHKGATAKALLAFMPAAQRRASLEALSPETALDNVARAELVRQLQLVQAQGYAVSDSEVDAGIWGVSAPLYQQPGDVAIAVITLMAPSSRAKGQEKRFIDMTVRGAARISSRLQCC